MIIADRGRHVAEAEFDKYKFVGYEIAIFSKCWEISVKYGPKQIITAQRRVPYKKDLQAIRNGKTSAT